MADDYLVSTEAWRQDMVKNLRAPNGWLALAGLSWLHEGADLIGADPAAAGPLPPGPGPPHPGPRPPMPVSRPARPLPTWAGSRSTDPRLCFTSPETTQSWSWGRPSSASHSSPTSPIL